MLSTLEIDLIMLKPDNWEREREASVAAESPLPAWRIGMLTEQITPCPRCGSQVPAWAKGRLVPQCARCGLQAVSVTGYRIVWPYGGDGLWSEPRRQT